MREEYFNASAAYAQAMRLEKKVDECRRTVAGTLGTDEAGICFTSGGTESDNLALMGSAATWHQKGSILISMVEHPAVYETVKRLEAQGFEVKRMPVDKYGAVDLHAAEEMISENTLMISCMHVNNETGAIQPIEEISRRLKKANPNACMHVDGVQGYLRVPVHMKKMGISDLALRSYKDLSGGQQQRVLLARALCATGKVLLLDEPVAGLDPKVTSSLYTLISDLNKEGITIIMVSHDIDAAIKYASHILHIGEEVFFGTADEYLHSKAGKAFMAQK